MIRINFGFVIFMIIAAVLNLDSLASKVNYNLSSSYMSKEVSSIYNFNFENFDKSSKLSYNYIELITSVSKYTRECNIKKSSDELPYLSGYTQRLWFYALNKIVPSINHDGKTPVSVFSDYVNYDDIKNNNNIKCILVDDDYMKKNNINSDDYDVLYHNKIGKLLIKK